MVAKRVDGIIVASQDIEQYVGHAFLRLRPDRSPCLLSASIGLTITHLVAGETDALSMRDAPANTRDAPYPLILTGNATGDVFDEHLVTHGFVMVEVEPKIIRAGRRSGKTG